MARLEEALNYEDLTCKRPIFFAQDCETGWVSPSPLPKGMLHFPGVSLKAAATADGKIVMFLSQETGGLSSGVRPWQIANYTYAEVDRSLRESGIAIDRVRALRFLGSLAGYVLETDGNAYAALKRASAAGPVPPPPPRAVSEVTSRDERPSLNPWGGPDSALLVTAPPIVIEEARAHDAIYSANCSNVFLFVQSCSNWTGPQLEVAIGPVRARVGATRAGDALMISGPSDFAGDFKRKFDPRETDPVNLSTRAVLTVLRANRFEIRRVRAVVSSRRGPVYAYLVELGSDGFSYLRMRAVASEKPSAR